MRSSVIERLEKSFAIYNELATHLEETSLKSKLGNFPSNTIGQQLWCVVGARESYSKGIQAGKWNGFSCSLRVTDNKSAVVEALAKSAQLAVNVFKDIPTFTDAQSNLAFDLLEHEAQHQGQLIRYLYALKLPVPPALRAKYHL